MFALVDCNNFYASCERVFRPNLNEKPVVVLSNNDGCVIARSEEAKAAGIPMGAPAHKYETLFKKHNIHVFSSNYALYGDMSARVMNLLAEFAPEIEIYSIDEAFLKFGQAPHLDYQKHAEKIRNYVFKCTGIPISVGIAPTKSLAKTANKIAKKFSKQLNNVYIIDNEEKQRKALKWLPVSKVWGIGRRYANKLEHNGIHTALDFIQQPDDWVKRNMSVVGLRLKHDLSGKAILDLEGVQAKKNIATTRSFDKNYDDFTYVKERVTTFAVSCGEKLRRQQSTCNALMVFIHTNSHRKDLPQYSRNIVVQLPFPTNSSIELSKFAVLGLKQIFRKGYAYKKAGVIVMDIKPADNRQLSLFENSNPRHDALMKAVDFLNTTIGQEKVKLAAQGSGRMWKMRQEKLSPRYTTKLNEIITIHAL
ncbi:MAG: Y-family DNA polymerase [Chitinophagaceae bacterium]|nr:MAG: Y-family DNA polymerase [Chitinophagaceae bacterium]